MSAWLWYVLLLGTMLSAFALVAEASLRAVGRGGRWSWLLAMTAGVVLPAWAYLRPAKVIAPDALFAPVLELAPIVLSAPVTGAQTDWTRVPVYAWLAASALTVVVLLLSQRALLRSRRGWREAELDGVSVLVSRDIGPAVVGVTRPRIVVPEWLLTLDAALRRLMLVHEEQHRRAGDSRLLIAGLALCALMPWNLFLWWQLHRLRVAMELDCDERVLAGGADPNRYGQLLIEVGRRRTERHLLATAFAEPRVLLERRVRALLRWPRTRRPLSAAAFGGAALLLLGFAYATPDPLARAQQPAPSLVEAVIDRVTSPPVAPMVQDTPPPAEKPRFTPMTQRPELTNSPVVQRALVENYPPMLRDAGIGGMAVVWLFVDETGKVVRLQLSRSSGHAALDEAALKVMSVAEFKPALNKDSVVAVWVEVPVTFSSSPKRAATQPARAPQDQGNLTPVLTVPAAGFEQRTLLNDIDVVLALRKEYPPMLQDAGIGGTVVVAIYASADGRVDKLQVHKSSGYQALDEAGLRVATVMQFAKADSASWVQVPIVFAPPTQLGNSPTFTPMTQRPELTNSSEVQRALVAAYPPDLRDAGIGGRPVIWFFVERDGTVARTQLSKSSGYPALDAAALQVAAIMKFTPARNKDRVVPVWIEIPIEFSAK